MPHKIKCFYQNTRGLRSKIAHGLKTRISNTDYHLIALTETWLNDQFASESIFDKDTFTVQVHRADRTHRTFTRPNGPHSTNSNDNLRGGGSLIALNKNIPCLRMNEWELESPYDNVWLKISTCNSNKVFINCVYINDKTTFDTLIIYLDLLIDIMNRREPDAHFIIVGDFNLPNIDWLHVDGKNLANNYEGRMSTEFLNMLTCTNLDQINHIKNAYNRTLDLILTNKPNIRCKLANGIVNEDIYHPAISFSFDSSGIKFMKIKNRAKLNYFKSDYNSFNEDLKLIDWNKMFANKDINLAVDEFYETTKTLTKKHTPSITTSQNEYPIWFSKQLIKLINEKEHLFKLKKRTNNPIHILLHKQKRNAIKAERKRCINEYESNIESKIKSNPRAFFAYTKALHKSNNLPLVMKYKDHNLTH